MSGRHPGFAFGRRATAWLSAATLLGLLLVQAFHAPAAARWPDAGRAAVVAVDAHATAHDTGGCQVCRAVSQMRSGLRAAVQLVAAEELLRPLGLASALAPSTAPALRNAWPRAPPAELSA